ncbi:hypothetical protein RJ639_047577 [Escallonia herrerae]|uniref:BHLH domain-containing protein n=1 Tax=Escallonia herrerae TaxID=1293975 RepID=A0AA88W6M1_9ASTE|nr:hypothetical protein RJ639_047577 [Escallonia herrerae]
MDSDLQHHRQQHQQHQQINPGLARYRSAPSSYFANLMNSGVYGGAEDCDPFLNPRHSSPETERIIARFMASGGAEDSTAQNASGIGQNQGMQPQFVSPMKQELEALQPQQQQQQMVYQSQSQPLDHKTVAVASTSMLGNSYSGEGSMALERLPQMKMGIGNNSSLIRHSSLPTGLFSHINVESGYPVMRGIGDFGAGSGTNAEASFSSASRLKRQLDYSPGQPSSSGLLATISEMGGKNMRMSSPDNEIYEEGHTKEGSYATGFPSSSWDDSAILSDNFLKELEDSDRRTLSNLNSSENQSGEGGHRTPTMLSHHLSLPTSSAELSAMEKLLEFQDSVPLKIRAKRGCATHPRSIAERVRRTRISERMRKLQELVPNMDKQTNTADMLDLAVDYIKDLQKKVKTLSDTRAKCTCANKQNHNKA